MPVQFRTVLSKQTGHSVQFILVQLSQVLFLRSVHAFKLNDNAQRLYTGCGKTWKPRHNEKHVL